MKITRKTRTATKGEANMRKTKLERVMEAITVTTETPAEFVECAYCKCHVKDEQMFKCSADGKQDIYGCDDCFSSASHIANWVNDELYSII